jgi:hypothetical protein
MTILFKSISYTAELQIPLSDKYVQPDKVTYFPKEMELRSNWTMEEEWNIE